MARTVKCLGCGADLTVRDDNRDFMFCEFCGTKVRLDDYQGIQESKDAKELRIKEMEQERWRTEDANKTAATYFKWLGTVIVILVIAYIICMGLGIA